MYNEIKEQFKRIIEFSQDISDINVNQLFEQWLDAKRDFIEAFDGKLIYEVEQPVNFHLDDSGRQKHFDEFVNRIYNTYGKEELVEFLNANRKGFFDNMVVQEYEKNDIKIPIGMKLVKAFKYFENDKNLLDQFQSMASQVIQEDRIEGKLCFSVHPLDYLTTSVNTYNWRSCHALDGEYRAGNLSYMIDKTTVVCYLKGADDVMLPMLPYNIPWNSKKWRVLLFFGENWNIVFAGRQYPFTSMAGLDITLEHLFSAFKLPGDRYSRWHNDYIDDVQGKERRYSLCTRYMPYRGRLYDYFEVVQDCQWPLHFNDLLRSSTYEDPYYIIKDNFGWWSDKNDLPKVTVGKQVKCLRCNSRRVRDADMMVCRECAERYGFYLDDENSAVCDCCGCRIYDGDWHHVEDEILCSNCYSTETFYCPRCDCDRFNSDRRYDRVEEEYVCCYCYDDE